MNLAANHGIYAITDCVNHSSSEVLEKTETILKGGAALLQYRDKKNNFEHKLKLANELKLLCNKFNVPLIINDDIELAKKISADGVHLGRHDQDIKTTREYLGSIIIGISCYNDFNRAVMAKNLGADYIAFGSFYLSPTKPDAVTANTELLINAKKEINLPIVAIGGITPENGKVLLDNGADFLAIISGLYSAEDTNTALKEYMKLFTN